MKKKLSVIVMLAALLVSVLPVNILGAGVACSGDCDHLAAIGGTHYASVQEALDAAEDGQTVKVLKSHNLDVSVVKDVPEVGEKTLIYVKYNQTGTPKPVTELQGITLDLNGMIITADYENYEHYDNVNTPKATSFLTVSSGTKLILADSSANKTGTLHGNTTQDRLKMRFILLNVNNSDNDYGEAGYSLVIQGGNYILDYGGSSDAVVYATNDLTTLIDGGYFEAGNTGQVAGGNGSPWMVNVAQADANRCVITGGTFIVDVNRQHYEVEAWITKGYACVPNTDGETWSVVPSKLYYDEYHTIHNWYNPGDWPCIYRKEAYLRETGFTDLKTAVNWANGFTHKVTRPDGVDYEKITLLDDQTLDSTLTMQKDFVFDRAGKTIKWTGTGATPVFELAAGVTVEGFALVREGYESVEYFIDSDFQTEWNNQQEYGEAVTVYAKWTAPDLAGTVTLPADVKVGDTLTATLVGGNAVDALEYAWYRDSESTEPVQIGTSETHTITEEDILFDIYCEVTCSSPEQAGTITSNRVTVPLMQLDVQVETFSGEYDGREHGVTVTVQQAGATVRFSEDGETYDLEESPVFSKVGTHTVYYQITKEKYETVTGEARVSIYRPYEPTYRIHTDATPGGQVQLNTSRPNVGTRVVITPVADAGYELDNLLVTDVSGNTVPLFDNGDGTYAYFQPYADTNIRAEFVAVEETTEPDEPGVIEPEEPMDNPFADVAEGDYFYDAVLWAVENDVTEGTAPDTFSPQLEATREQVVMFLWRAAGCPEPVGQDMPFSDVDMTGEYAKAILWAAENGITEGVDDGLFGPEQLCTRAQVLTMLCRMAGGEAEGTEIAFADVEADAYYAPAVQWAFELGITDGVGNDRFAPDAACTRGQIMTFLYRYMG